MNCSVARILDPMAGSGTTLVAAKLKGHQATGYDRDPLAVLQARTWLSSVDRELCENRATSVMKTAQKLEKSLTSAEAFPYGADDETKEFSKFWFDEQNRQEITALSYAIKRTKNTCIRDVLWCALSRLIITKAQGVSLAMDVSHSRPHKVYAKAPMSAFEQFERSVRIVLGRMPFINCDTDRNTSANIGDARSLPEPNASYDMVITSPPYLNAIDYIRAHKFSLIWMGYTIADLRKIRSTNIGTEAAFTGRSADDEIGSVVFKMCGKSILTPLQNRLLKQYAMDIRSTLVEVERVLKPGGSAVFVVGDCISRGTYIENSLCVETIARSLGLSLKSKVRRNLPENRRYLPPPTSGVAGIALQRRMRDEVILKFMKT